MSIHDKKEVESVTLQERLRQMASIAITHPQFTDYVNNALEAALEAADALDQKDAEIERLTELWETANTRLRGKDKHIAKLQAALESIANNTCCEGCQEAKRVALAALETDDE